MIHPASEPRGKFPNLGWNPGPLAVKLQSPKHCQGTPIALFFNIIKF